MLLTLGFPVRVSLAISVIAVSALAQVKAPTDQQESAQASPQLMDENEYYRVSRVQLAPGSKERIQQNDRDSVIVVLSEDSLTITTPEISNPERLSRGDVRFLSRGVSRSVANPSDHLSQLLVVEVKRHWDVEIRPCIEPMKCTRPIQMGQEEIGETTSLFTNGFVTAYRHHLSPGGILTSSYFSAKGKDHLLLVALTDLQANFDGSGEKLKRGQAYTSDATEVEVNAQTAGAMWVVIRVLVPKA